MLKEIAALIIVANGLIKIVKDLKPFYDKIDLINFIRENNLAKAALGIELGTYSAVHNSIHPIVTNKIHPDNEYALKIVSAIEVLKAKNDNKIEITDLQQNSQLNTNFHFIGSAISEKNTKLLFDYVPSLVDGYLHYRGNLVDFPITWVLDENSADTIKRRDIRNSMEQISPNWGLRIKRENDMDDILWPTYDISTGLLLEDYLVVTRMPNFMCNDALEQKKSIVSIGGTHGVGTVAIDYLLRDKKMLNKVGQFLNEKKVNDDIKFQRYFGMQMVFKVKAIYDKNGDMENINVIDIMDDPIIFGKSKEPWEHAMRKFQELNS